MLELDITTTPPYTIFIKEGLLQESSMYDVCKVMAKRWVIISDEHVASYYGEPLKTRLSETFRCDLLTVKPGDRNKTRAAKAALEDQLFELGCGHDTGIIALGGGVVTDLAGFVAATYNRGIPVIYVPTSLLAMVDACIGGKTAVNTPYGKNLIGVFNQPVAVYIDLNTLTTLSSESYIDGLIETFKHALISDKNLWSALSEFHYNDLLQLDYAKLTEIVYRSMELKAKIITQDVKEKGLRQVLNFGHTIGHAIEAASQFRLSHGQSVAYGMIAESYMSNALGLLCENDFNEIVHTIHPLLDKPFDELKLDKARLLKYLSYDKKALNQQPRFVLLDGIAKPHVTDQRYAHTVPDAIIEASMQTLFHNEVETLT